MLSSFKWGLVKFELFLETGNSIKMVVEILSNF